MHYLTSYLLSANLLLAIGYFAYYSLYHKEGKLQFNRLLLLGISLGAWLIPLFPWSTMISNWSEVSNISPQVLETFNFTPSEKISTTISITEIPQDEVVATKNWIPLVISIVGVVYLAITATLFLRFLISLGSLFRLARRFPRERREDHIVLHATEEISPFSFFKMIILNPKLYQQEQYELIYQHELVHARQWHNLDILIAELCCMVSWFNPLAWKMKLHIRQNLEFIADAAVLETGVNRKVYQYCLLRLNVGSNHQFQIANHFNQSLLKKRILMMNRQKSPNTFSFKHLLLLPLLAVMVLASYPLQSQSAKSSTEYGPNSVTDHPANSVTDHPGETDPDPFAEAPVLDGESVYGIIKADLTIEDLEILKGEFAKRGVKIQASDINFTAEGKLASIKLELTQWNKSTIVQKLDNGTQPIEGFICIFLQHNKAEKSATVGMLQEFPNFLTEELQKQFFLDQIIGTAITAQNGKDYTAYLKGSLDMGDGVVLPFDGSVKRTEEN